MGKAASRFGQTLQGQFNCNKIAICLMSAVIVSNNTFYLQLSHECLPTLMIHATSHTTTGYRTRLAVSIAVLRK